MSDWREFNAVICGYVYLTRDLLRMIICCMAFSWNKKTVQLKLEHSGEGPFLDVVPHCQFYKLPHKVKIKKINLCSLFFIVSVMPSSISA